MNDLVSIIILTYNKSSTLHSTISSVINQSYQNIQIILVDDHSSDNSKEIVAQYVKTYPNIESIFLKTNQGPAESRNIGIRRALGEYIFFLDGDDVLFRDKISSQIEFMQKNKNFGLSLTPYLILSKNKSHLRYISYSRVASLLVGWHSMTGFGGLVESTGCIRRSFLDESLYFNKNLSSSEGLDFTIKWHNKFDVGIMEEPLTIYRLTSNQLHRNTSLISINMKEINNLYVKSRYVRYIYSRFQKSHIFLDSLRSERILRILFSFFSRVNMYNYIIALFIIYRNLVAILKGLKYTKVLRYKINTNDL